MKKVALLVLGVYSSLGISQTNLVVCQDDGFEGLNTGTLVSAAWTASYSQGQTNGGLMNFATTYSAGSNYANVISTPYSDYYMGTIPASPFAGNKAVLLNYGNYSQRTRIGKTITVTPSNFIYRYAYRAVLGGSSPFSSGALRFNFYDCSGNLLTNLSKTIEPSAYSVSLSNPDSTYWQDVVGSGGLNTPKWIVADINLSAYVGSCVKVIAEADPCTCGGYLAYCYYDDMCSDKFVSANPIIPMDGIPRNTLVTTNNYMSCAGTATLTGLPGFSSYLWQGPAGSSVAGSTLATITTTQPGTYTLTAMTGSFSFSQEINLTLGNPLPAIPGSFSVCTGDTLVLQGSGATVNSYSWNTGAITPSIHIIPSSATTTAPVIYSLSTTDNLNCALTLTFSVTHTATHPINVLESITPVCEGQNINFMASGSNVNMSDYTFLWSTGATTSSISVTPTAGLYVCSVAETETTGCTSVISKMVIVYPLPQVQINAATDICIGQSVNLTTQGSNMASYLWSNGSTQPSVVVNPTQTAVYTVTVASSHYCKATNSETITVHELPQVEIIQPVHVCVGEPFSLTAQGDHMNSYLWSNGDNTQTLSDVIMGDAPYTVTVTTAYGCTSVSSTYLTTDPLPLLQVSADATTICEGASVNLAVAGSLGISYSWDNGDTNQSIQVSPVNTSTYVVVGTDANGCTSTISTVVTVSKCTGIEQAALNSASGLIVFPNPAANMFTIKGYKTGSGQIFNSLGQLIREFTLNSENNFSVDVSGLPKGVYFVKNGSSVINVAVN